MKKQYTVLFGPVSGSELGELLIATESKAMLIEVKLIPKINSDKPLLVTGIRRHTVTDSDVEKMVELRMADKSAESIARIIGCSEITVRRHAPKQEKLI